jgi:hypothetical protein
MSAFSFNRNNAPRDNTIPPSTPRRSDQPGGGTGSTPRQQNTTPSQRDRGNQSNQDTPSQRDRGHEPHGDLSDDEDLPDPITALQNARLASSKGPTPQGRRQIHVQREPDLEDDDEGEGIPQLPSSALFAPSTKKSIAVTVRLLNWSGLLTLIIHVIGLGNHLCSTSPAHSGPRSD